MPVGEVYQKYYKEYDWISQGRSITNSVFGKDIVFVSYPTRDNIMKLVKDNSHDVFIIVDRLKTSKEHLLNCRGQVVYAVSGNSCLGNFNVEKRCISLQSERLGVVCSRYLYFRAILRLWIRGYRCMIDSVLRHMRRYIVGGDRVWLIYMDL